MEAWGMLFIASAGAIIRGALSARPPNVTYIVQEETCNLNVSWLPAEPPSRNCTQNYVVALRINGRWNRRSEKCLRDPVWTTEVLLGEKIDFGVQVSCDKDCQEVSPWNDDEAFHVVQNGAAGTGARNINCTWWNRNYMECSWISGVNASSDTPYKLFYKCDKVHQCKNITREGPYFQCGFDCVVGNVPRIIISVQGNSGDIQTTCLLLDSINSLVKLHPPRITNISKSGSEVFLKWTEPDELNNLCYQVEVTSKRDHNSKPDSKSFKNTGSATIPVEPDVQYTFRVRVKPEEGNWSAWSKMEVIGGTTSIFPILLFILIPLCVALLLVILLIYLKRIKLLILPKIPDPEQILKYMFQEQNENQPTHEIVNNEETHSLMIVEPVEPAGNEK